MKSSLDDPGSIPLLVAFAGPPLSGSPEVFNLSAYSWHIVGVILCFMLVFLFSGLEAGLLSLNRIWLSEKVSSGSRRASKLQEILRVPSRLIAVMLTMETTCSVILAVLWTDIGTQGVETYGLAAWWLIVWGGLLIIILVMFCEIIPKALFATNAERITITFAPIAYNLIRIVYPIAAVLEFISKIIIWVFTKKWIRPRTSKVTEEDLMTMVSVGEDEGVLEEQEKEIIHSIFEFGDLVAREIMVPRIDMLAIEINDSIKEALNLIIDSGHSRTPVYEGSTDHIKGLLYAKDALKYVEEGTLEKQTVRELMRTDVFFVPESKGINSLLEEMRVRKSHIAVIMDEYGGTEGLVTIEDILEEIVGDIQDESDKPLERLVSKEADGTFIVEARLGLHDFVDEVGIGLPEEDGVETVGGLLYKVLGRVPEVGEIVTVAPVKLEKYEGYINDESEVVEVQLKVLEVEENRIGRVHVCLLRGEGGQCPADVLEPVRRNGEVREQ